MRRRRLLVAAGAVLLLVIVPCTLPPEEEAKGCESQPQASDARARWHDSSTLVYVPAGEFPMGVPGGQDNPQHQVLLDDFWIQKTEVTNGMYAACVAAGGCTIPGPDPSLPDYSDASIADHPVVGVNWAQADTYCRWIQGRLPTEAEWEKAGRGTDGRSYPWGEDPPDCDRTNFQPCGGKLTSVIDHPTGASPYDALDFSGNAFEWVSDWYKATYYVESPAENPPGPTSGELRVLRGGSFVSNADEVRPVTRGSANPLTVRADLGFRCVVLDAQCFAPPCETTSAIGRPYVPRQAPDSGEVSCDPAPVDVGVEPYCQRKMPYVNIDPDGAAITWPEGQDCGPEADLYVCTGDQETSFEIEACTSCMPPTPEAITEQPSCPPNYALDEARCACRFVGRSSGTICPSMFAMLYVPELQCCELQPPAISLGRVVPRCDPGYVPYGDCTCIGRLPAEPEPVTLCETISVTLPSCGAPPQIESGCPEGACQPPSSWDSGKCCCAIRGRCQ